MAGFSRGSHRRTRGHPARHRPRPLAMDLVRPQYLRRAPTQHAHRAGHPRRYRRTRAGQPGGGRTRPDGSANTDRSAPPDRVSRYRNDVNASPDSSAVRTALWRALHVQLDAPPHVIEDEIGLALAAPEAGWRDRPDMHPVGTGGYRAAIVARTRFVEDLLVEEDIGQYVLLGAGLDTFAQRHPELGEQVRVFEIDQPVPQAWKRQRLEELGYGVPERLR